MITSLCSFFQDKILLIENIEDGVEQMETCFA